MATKGFNGQEISWVHLTIIGCNGFNIARKRDHIFQLNVQVNTPFPAVAISVETNVKLKIAIYEPN